MTNTKMEIELSVLKIDADKVNKEDFEIKYKGKCIKKHITSMYLICVNPSDDMKESSDKFSMEVCEKLKKDEFEYIKKSGTWKCKICGYQDTQKWKVEQHDHLSD